MGNFSFFYPSNIEIIFDFSDFSDRGGENSPPFQNPGSAPGESYCNEQLVQGQTTTMHLTCRSL